MGVRRIERVVRAEGIAPAGSEIAVGHAHMVRETHAEREFVQPLAESDVLDVGDQPSLAPFDLPHIGDHAVGVVPAVETESWRVW